MTEQMMDAPEFEYARFLNYGTESDLVDIATAYAKSAMPEWVPRAGNTEMVLMESLALMLGVEVLAIQQMPNQVVEQIMGLYGVRRDEGQEAVGRARFTVTNSNPTQVIPAGTRLRMYIGDTGETVDLLTLETATIITSETLTGEVNVYTDVRGPGVNGTPVGTRLSVVDALLPFVEDVRLSLALANGAGVESDNAFFGRAAAALARLTSTLVSPESFQYAALTMAGIGRAQVYDLYNPDTPAVPVAGGHVTIAVAGMDGLALPSLIMNALENTLESQALASLNIHVIAPTYTTVNLNITVRATPGYTEDQVRASVDAAIRGYVNPKTWDWSSTITQYSLIAKIAGAPGVREATSVPANVALAGKAPLPILGSLNITVTA